MSHNSKSIPESDFQKAYNSHQAIHIRRAHASANDTSLDSSSIQSLFQSLVEADKASWCIENKSNLDGGDVAPCDFLNTNNTDHKGYCSFLVQHSTSAMEDLLSCRLPMAHLPICSNESTEDGVDSLMPMKYGPCIWFFFGKNYQNAVRNTSSTSGKSNKQPPEALLGRPEHTDSISHDGTWHYQLSGKKVWRLRPSAELVNRIHLCNSGDDGGDEKSRNVSSKKRNISSLLNEDTSNNEEEDNTRVIELECEQGDVLLLNTQLWWHSTLIPPQDSPSISYARDVYFVEQTKHSTEDSEKENVENIAHESIQQQEHQQQSSMTNVDGTYAAQDIEASTILFTEHTMPDCELHRSKTNPNCQVVELEDETTGECYMAVVSIRDIKAGEFFYVMESDSEDNGEEDEEGISEEEEEEEETDYIE
ncbi:hypothetical protein HJC23_000964 [Cyclotella cryptica]|uniref:Uncharacterized protein n=1 Tax=Cyclotella cryptica TaxID=29204 RepID=A0ABD3QNM6_9STRA